MSERLLAEAGPYLSPGIEITDGALRLVRAFERLRMETFLADPDIRAETYQALDFPTYTSWMNWANCTARNATPEERRREPYPGRLFIQNPELKLPTARYFNKDIFYCPPAPHDGFVLQTEAFAVAKHLPDIESSATLLRLVNFLTHRNFNGNTRVSALAYSALTHGYNGTPRDKAHYLMLLQGNKGVHAVGMGIDTTYLNETFARHRTQHVAAEMHYKGPLPVGVTPFRVGDLFDMRRDLHPRGLMQTSLYLAERHMNLPLILKLMQTQGFELAAFLTTGEKGEPVINMQELFGCVAESDVMAIEELQDDIKRDFIRSIISCFQGETSVYGPYQDLVARLRAKSTATGQLTSLAV